MFEDCPQMQFYKLRLIPRHILSPFFRNFAAKGYEKKTQITGQITNHRTDERTDRLTDRRNKKNFQKFITRKPLARERSSFHQKVQNYLKYLPYQFRPRSHSATKLPKLPQNVSSENWKTGFLPHVSKNRNSFDFFLKQ